MEWGCKGVCRGRIQDRWLRPNSKFPSGRDDNDDERERQQPDDRTGERGERRQGDVIYAVQRFVQPHDANIQSRTLSQS